MSTKKTSIRVPEELWENVKKEAKIRRTSASKITEQALRNELSSKPFSGKPFSPPNPLFAKEATRKKKQ